MSTPTPISGNRTVSVISNDIEASEQASAKQELVKQEAVKQTPAITRLAISKDEPGSNIDLVFAIDSTGSMGTVIKTVKENIQTILETIAKFPHCASLRYSLIEYRDHNPRDVSSNSERYYPWVIKHTVPFTENLQEMLLGVQNVEIQSGCDISEAVTDGLAALSRMSWREDAAKVAIVMGDAPPHGLLSTDNEDLFRDGCPCGESWKEQVSSLRESGIVLHTVGCETGVGTMQTADSRQAAIEVFQYIAKETRGQFFTLSKSAEKLPGLITGIANRELEQMRVSRQVLRIMQEKDTYERLLQIKNEDNRAAAFYTELSMRGVQTGVVDPATGEIEGRDLTMMDFAGVIASLRRNNAWDGKVSNVLFPTWKGNFKRLVGLFAVPTNPANSANSKQEEVIPRTFAELDASSANQKQNQEERVIPLTAVDVQVAVQQGSASEITLLQTYENNTNLNMEAIYKFPLDGTAAVTGFVAEIDNKKIYAECLKKEKAQKVYQEAVKRGDGAFLLDQQANHIFEMKLGNILPGQKVKIRLTYIQLLEPQISKSLTQIDRLLLPTTIAPPYTPERSKKDLQVIGKAASLEPASAASYSLDISMDIEMLQPLLSIESPSHPIQMTIDPKNNKRAKVILVGERTSLDRDFIVDLKTERPAVLPGSFYVMEQWQKPSFEENNNHSKEMVDLKKEKDTAATATSIVAGIVGVQATFRPVFNGASNKWIIQAPKTAANTATAVASKAASQTATTTATTRATAVTQASITTTSNAGSAALTTEVSHQDSIDSKSTGERANLKLRVLCDVSNSLTGDAAKRIQEGIEYIKTKRFPSDADIAIYKFASDAKLVYTNGKTNHGETPLFVGFNTTEDLSKPALFSQPGFFSQTTSARSIGNGTELLRLLELVTRYASKENPVAILLCTDGELNADTDRRQVEEIIKLLKYKNQAVELYIIGVGYTIRQATLRELVHAASTGAIEFCHPTESLADKIDHHMERMLLGLREISMEWSDATNADNELVERQDLKPLTSSASLSCILSGETVSTFGLLQPGQKSTLSMRAKSWTGVQYKWKLEIDTTNPEIRRGHLLPRLAGRAFIQDWEEMSYGVTPYLTGARIVKKDLEPKIVEIGETLNLSSTVTSFVAVEERDIEPKLLAGNGNNGSSGNNGSNSINASNGINSSNGINNSNDIDGSKGQTKKIRVYVPQQEMAQKKEMAQQDKIHYVKKSIPCEKGVSNGTVCFGAMFFSEPVSQGMSTGGSATGSTTGSVTKGATGSTGMIVYEKENAESKHIAALQLGCYAQSQLAQHSVNGVLAKITREQWVEGVYILFEAAVSREFFETFATTLHGRAGGLNVLVNAAQRMLAVQLIDQSKPKKNEPNKSHVLVKVATDGRFVITTTTPSKNTAKGNGRVTTISSAATLPLTAAAQSTAAPITAAAPVIFTSAANTTNTTSVASATTCSTAASVPAGILVPDLDRKQVNK